MYSGAVSSDVRVLIVAEHASFRFGGEASLPLHYFLGLRKRGVECWLLLHERTAPELRELLGDEMQRVTLIPDTRLQILLWRVGSLLPHRLQAFTAAWAVRLITQLRQRRLVRRLVRDLRIDVVHEPIPVSPRMPSMLFDVGAPVIIGPMNGAMSFPPGFPHLDRRAETGLIEFGRKLSGLMNRLMPGKRKASLLLVANERTWAALPPCIQAPVQRFVENGVDLELWAAPNRAEHKREETVFCYMGRLVALKACDLMLGAFARVAAKQPARLILLGDGPEHARLQDLARELGIADKVEFRGWLSQQQCARVLADADALILPSLHECGGAVVLEGMAAGLPVIAAQWGGPADYIDPSCGILIPPKDPASYVAGMTDAMLRLARSPHLRDEMGRAAREKVEAEFCWTRRIEQMLEIYGEIVRPHRAASPRPVTLDLSADVLQAPEPQPAAS